MTLIVVVYVPVGIVVSGDSRATGTINQQVADPKDPSKTISVQNNIVVSDSAEKLFLLQNRIGIGICGDAFINDLPIAHYIDTFQAKVQTTASVQDVANDLLTHFSQFGKIPNVTIFVIGYDQTTPSVFVVEVANKKVSHVNIDAAKQNQVNYGILRGGDTEIVNRLLSQPQSLPPFQIMNVQDAIDYSRHLIRTTIDQLRFEPRFPTVGGSIDTIVVTSSGGDFLARKALHTS
jgi:hypothetical protein